ncbi:MAG: deoxyguanosinetriphosphate triphosphohydrolase [Catonella sp.]|jgi:dGTPase|nr:deoxyguanosinetriphosphate triphosphohydrolase [Catonella sp.]MDY6356283.1 deoxyguanosinetriphosphate triphosphohydrolase [Catonella sp.]
MPDNETRCLREEREKLEHIMLRPCATFADRSKGRDFPEEECDIRTCFQRDRDRILHSKPFRRLKHKTQVFLDPEGDHYRTRLTHTLEVAQISRTIARALRLNEDLTEAIALGHDLGHTPFGHAGERALNEVSPYGFFHNHQSVRVVEVLAKDGKGLNLTKEVRDGIQNHRSRTMPYTLEGKIVRISDKIAYVNHDIDDALRAGIIKEADIPSEYTEVLGNTVSDRIDTMVTDVIFASMDIEDIKMSERVEKAMLGMRSFLYDAVYSNPKAKSQEKQAENLVKFLYEYYNDHINEMPEEYVNIIKQGEFQEIVVCDYIAGMSDDYAVEKIKELFIPARWDVY